MASTYWLIALAILIVIEIATLGLTTIWFAGGSLVAFFVSLAIDSLLIEIVVFLVVSFLLLFFTRPIASRYLNSKRTKTNYEDFVGREVKVLEKIDNFNNTGLVLLNGLEWMARNTDETVIQPGEKVIVRAVSGAKVIVALDK
ncbi:MAG: NfeD family protein [Anaerocolumna sp.]